VLQRLMRERADMLARVNGVIEEALDLEQVMEWHRNEYTIPSLCVGVASGAFASPAAYTRWHSFQVHIAFEEQAKRNEVDDECCAHLPVMFHRPSWSPGRGYKCQALLLLDSMVRVQAQRLWTEIY
jgi:hypothetical protein